MMGYACQVWYLGLTVMQKHDREQVQMNVLQIIWPCQSYCRKPGTEQDYHFQREMASVVHRFISEN